MITTLTAARSDEAARPTAVRSPDQILKEARSLAARHGLNWRSATDREIAVTLVLGQP